MGLVRHLWAGRPRPYNWVFFRDFYRKGRKVRKDLRFIGSLRSFHSLWFVCKIPELKKLRGDGCILRMDL